MEKKETIYYTVQKKDKNRWKGGLDSYTLSEGTFDEDGLESAKKHLSKLKIPSRLTKITISFEVLETNNTKVKLPNRKEISQFLINMVQKKYKLFTVKKHYQKYIESELGRDAHDDFSNYKRSMKEMEELSNAYIVKYRNITITKLFLTTEEYINIKKHKSDRIKFEDKVFFCIKYSIQDINRNRKNQGRKPLLNIICKLNRK